MNEFLSMDMLVTFGGASIATAVLTQFLKGILHRIPTQIVSYIIALILLIITTLITGGVEHWVDWTIIPLNAALISLAANGEHSVVKRVLA
jgi:hypothetical protein